MFTPPHLPEEAVPVDLDPPSIATWDRRVRVFVSSTLEELAPERAAVREAVSGLHLTPVMFELGARAHPPRELYVSYLEQSDVFVGIYGERYGWIAPGSTISGLEDEYLLAADRPRLLYLRTPAPDRDPRLAALIERMWASSGASTAPFASASELGRRVADDLAVLLTERFRGAAGSSGDRMPRALSPAALPAPASALVDREAERGRIGELLADPQVRLVTLLGPGGIGKTRLALAVAHELGPRLDAVCFVDLSLATRPEQVLPAVAAALRVTPAARAVGEVLVDVLAGHRVLLVLDNVEHVLAAGPEIARLLAHCPALQVLATSRAVLHLRGEHEFPLGPLAVPSPGCGPSEVSASAAVRLFARRAGQVRPEFTVTPDNADQLADVVRRLEGIPLALELAAARMRLLPLSDVAPESTLDLASTEVDAPRRQRTMRSTIAWSHGLLEPAEQRALRSLSVVAGGWTAAAAQAVLDGVEGVEGDALAHLGQLVEQSLLMVDVDAPGEPRFRMLAAVRSYATEQLELAGDRALVMAALAGYVGELAERAEHGGGGPGSRRWRTRLDAELDAIRTVLAWAVDTDDATLAVTISARLTRYWWGRRVFTEMLTLAETVAGLNSAARLAPSEADLLAWSRGTMRIATGRTEQARPLLAAAERGARERGDRALLAQVWFSSALLAPAGDPAAERLLEQSLSAFTAARDLWGQALALIPLGDLDLLAGRVERARERHELALGHARTIEDDHLVALVHDQLAADALLAGHPQRAMELLDESARIHLELHDPEGMANCLDAVAALILFSGSLFGGPELAARYLGAADRVRRIAGVVVWPFLRPLRARLISAVASTLADSVFDENLARGGQWSATQALTAARRSWSTITG